MLVARWGDTAPKARRALQTGLDDVISPPTPFLRSP